MTAMCYATDRGLTFNTGGARCTNILWGPNVAQDEYPKRESGIQVPATVGFDLLPTSEAVAMACSVLVQRVLFKQAFAHPAMFEGSETPLWEALCDEVDANLRSAPPPGISEMEWVSRKYAFVRVSAGELLLSVSDLIDCAEGLADKARRKLKHEKCLAEVREDFVSALAESKRGVTSRMRLSSFLNLAQHVMDAAKESNKRWAAAGAQEGILPDTSSPASKTLEAFLTGMSMIERLLGDEEPDEQEPTLPESVGAEVKRALDEGYAVPPQTQSVKRRRNMRRKSPQHVNTAPDGDCAALRRELQEAGVLPDPGEKFDRLRGPGFEIGNLKKSEYEENFEG